MKKIITLTLVLLVSACSSNQGPRIFKTADAASLGLGEAAKNEDIDELNEIFGKEALQVLSSGDAVADRNGLEHFAELFSEKNQIEIVDNKYATLLLGNDDWPFPIPMIKNDAGWYFDTDEGLVEIVNRRIGRNEIMTIESVYSYVRAQKQYHLKDEDKDGVKEYAQKFISSPGKTDGLFWTEKSSKFISPLGPNAAKAFAEGYEFEQGKQAPYHGYFYKILSAQGSSAKGGKKSYLDSKGNMTRGFALLAYPVEWGKSGVMSFIVNQDGKVYQQSLGPNTEAEATKIKEFNPDSSWIKVD